MFDDFHDDRVGCRVIRIAAELQHIAHFRNADRIASMRAGSTSCFANGMMVHRQHRLRRSIMGTMPPAASDQKRTRAARAIGAPCGLPIDVATEVVSRECNAS